MVKCVYEGREPIYHQNHRQEIACYSIRILGTAY